MGSKVLLSCELKFLINNKFILTAMIWEEIFTFYNKKYRKSVQQQEQMEDSEETPI